MVVIYSIWTRTMEVYLLYGIGYLVLFKKRNIVLLMVNSFNPFVIAFKTWKDLVRKAIASNSLKTGIQYFIQPPGWSHDGSSQTVKELRVKESVKKEEKQDSIIA
jgi:hypothetical protein